MQPSFLVSRGHHYLGPDVVNEQGGQRSTTRPGAGEKGGPPAGISTLYPFTLAVDNAANFVHFTGKFKITVNLFNAVAESWLG